MHMIKLNVAAFPVVLWAPLMQKKLLVTAFAKFFESKVDKVPVCRMVDPGEDVRLVPVAAAAGDDPRNDSDQVVLKSSSPALSNKTSYHVVLYTLMWQSCSVLLINPT